VEQGFAMIGAAKMMMKAVSTTPPAQPCILTVDTTKAGSAADTFILPTDGASPYNYQVDWGDTVVENVVVNTDQTHVYAASGTYTVTITGTFPRIWFNNSGDKLKLIGLQLGDVGWTSLEQAFYGCVNLATISNVAALSAVTDYSSAWRDCSGLLSFPLINTGAGENFSNAWRSCTGLTSFPLIDTGNGLNFQAAWFTCSGLLSFPLIDTSAGTNFIYAWTLCSGLTDFPLIDTGEGLSFYQAWNTCSGLTSFPLIDTGKGTDFDGAWGGCVSLTSFPAINTGAATTIASAWYGCVGLTSFPLIDTREVLSFLGAWYHCTGLNGYAFPTLNMRKMTNGVICFSGVTLSTTSYSNLLIDMALGVTTGVTFSGGASQYNAGAVAAHTTLDTTRTWTITDGGLEP
jgi:hypothetical protein